ncbi:MAG: DUF692 domain-containing protein [Myxococcota bacterium]
MTRETPLGLPHLGWGIGLRAEHTSALLGEWPEVDWFEVITENVMDSGGRARAVVEAVAARYPVVLHGVSMNIGSTDPLDRRYLDRLAALAEALRPAWVSDHLCFTGLGGHNSHDLLPLPYTEDSLGHVVARVRDVQSHLGRPLVLENPSSYITFRASTMSESRFLARLAEEADCGLLVDLNNVAVSCFNHGWDPNAYLADLPSDRVVQLHLAGHSDLGSHRVDTHDGLVSEEVWDLYRRFYARIGGAATLVEWDAALPPLGVLIDEAGRARDIAQGRPVSPRADTSSKVAVPHPLHSRVREVGP